MKTTQNDNGWFRRILQWASESESEGADAPEDPEKQEFQEYLEYIDAHDYIEFGAYRYMRYQQRKELGLDEPTSHYTAEPPTPQKKQKGKKSHHKQGVLRKQLRWYQVASVLITCVIFWILCLVVMELPEFGALDAPAWNEVVQRYLQQGREETGAVNAITGMILEYRAFDTFGESVVLFAAAISTILLLRTPNQPLRQRKAGDEILKEPSKYLLPIILLFGFYVILYGHISPGGGFSGGAILGAALILASLVLGAGEVGRVLTSKRVTYITVFSLLTYAVMKFYSFYTGANHVGWEIPKGEAGHLFSGGFLLPLNLCVGLIVACTMYTFYTLFIPTEEE